MSTSTLYDGGLSARDMKLGSLNNATCDSIAEFDTDLTSQILASFRNKILNGGSMINETSKLNVYEQLPKIKTGKSEDLTGSHTQESVLAGVTDNTISQSPAKFESLQLSSSLTTMYHSQPVSTLCDVQRSPDSTSVVTPSPESPSDSFSVGSSQMSDHSSQSCLGELTMPTPDNNAPCHQLAPPKTHHLLPPCRVCGDKASGFHYGANTCEACKGFFRRSLKKNVVEYKCSSGNECIIQKGRRNNCPLCRYNKCLSVGMSKQAIKTGRYTHEKRTKDIVEVKQLEGDLIPHLSKHSGRSDVMTAQCNSQSILSEEKMELIDRINNSHKVLFPLWHKLIDSGTLPDIMKKFAEKYQLKKSMVDSSQNVIKEEYKQFFPETKVDVDDRANTIDSLTNHLELAIMTFVKFAKAVPGFCELPLNDQATLVKLSRFEIWMIGAHKFLNAELQVVCGPRGNAYHVEELSQVIDGDFVTSMFSFAKSLQMINLSNRETALLKTVVLMFSDRSDLQESGKVEAIQLKLISCLEALLNSGRRFSQVMNALVKLRDLTEWHKKISENLILEWPTIKHNPLLLEIMSV